MVSAGSSQNPQALEHDLWDLYSRIKQHQVNLNQLVASNQGETRYKTLSDDADRVAESAEYIIKNQPGLARRSLNITASQTPIMTDAQLSEVVDDLHAAFAQMIVRHRQSSGIYKEPVDPVNPIHRIFGFIVLVLFVIYIVIPVGQFLGVVAAYAQGWLAERSASWPTAISQYGYAYRVQNFSDSQQRLAESYVQAIQLELAGENWESAQELANAFVETSIAPERARLALNDSYFLPAQAAFDDNAFADALLLLNALIPPLTTEQELLYKRNLVAETVVLSAAQNPDWSIIEDLLQDYLQRPRTVTSEGLRLDQQVYDLLSISYTERADAIMNDATNPNRWQDARAMLQLALGEPASRSENRELAAEMFRDSYYLPAVNYMLAREYLAARAPLESLIALNPDQPHKDSPTLLRDSYYLYARDLVNRGAYEDAREQLDLLYVVNGLVPYQDSVALLRDTFILPAREALNKPLPTMDDFLAARAELEVLFQRDPAAANGVEAITLYRDTFLRPALNLLTQDEPIPLADIMAARELLLEVLREDAASADHRIPGDPISLIDRFYSTYLGPISDVLGNNPQLDDYRAARAIYRQLLFEDYPTSYDDQPSIVSAYWLTYTTPARDALSALQPDETDYELAREELWQLFQDDSKAEAETSITQLFRRAYLEPAEIRLDTLDDEGARALLEELFARNQNSRQDREAAELYFRASLPPAERLLESQDFRDARALYTDLVLLAEETNLPERRAYAAIQLRETYYQEAQVLMSDEQFVEARAVLVDLRALDNDVNTYRNADELFHLTYYLPAEILFEDQQYLEARPYYEDLIALATPDQREPSTPVNPFQDTEDLYRKTFQLYGMKLLSEEDYAGAQHEFRTLVTLYANEPPLYQSQPMPADVIAIIAPAFYAPAQQAFDAQEWETAIPLLRELLLIERDYADAAILFTQSYRALIEADLAIPDFDLALLHYQELSEVLDSEELFADLLAQVYYERAQTAFGEERWEDARADAQLVFDIAPNYQDVGTLYLDTFYEPGRRLLDQGRIESNAALCLDARTILENEMPMDAQRDFRDAQTLINETYLCEIEIDINGGKLTDAHQKLLDLQTRSPFYRDIDDLLRRMYFDPAREAIDIATANNDLPKWEEARGHLLNLLCIEPFYGRENISASRLLFDTYYRPALELFDAGEYHAARERIDLLREPKPCQTSISQEATSNRQVLVDLNFKPDYAEFTAEELYAETFLREAARAAEAGDWQTAQIELGMLQNENPDYPTARQRYYESYFTPGLIALNEEDWGSAKANLRRLLNTPMFTMDDAPANAGILYREAFIRPAAIALKTGKWDDVRTELWELLDVNTPGYGTPSFRPSSLPDLASHAQDYISLDGESAQELLRESYYVPASMALETTNWSGASTLFNELYGLDPNYKDVARLRIDAHLLPAQTAIDNENWSLARDNLEEALARERQELTGRAVTRYNIAAGAFSSLGYMMPEEAAHPDSDTLQAAVDYVNQMESEVEVTQNALIDTYRLPVTKALDTEDWSAARAQLEAWEAALDTLDESKRVASQNEILNLTHQSYLDPFHQALEAKNYEAARAALREYNAALDVRPDLVAAFPQDREQSVVWERQTYEVALDDAIAAQDWFSAAQQYMALRMRSVDDSTLAAKLAEQPQLMAALGRQFRAYWSRLENTAPRTFTVPAPVTEAELSDGGLRLATYGLDGMLRIWALDYTTDAAAVDINPTSLVAAQTEASRISAIKFSDGDGRWLATATTGESGNVVIWDTISGQIIETLRDPESVVNVLALTVDGKWLAAGSEDERVYIWNTDDWSIEPIILDIRQPISALVFSPLNNTIVVAQSNRDIQVWDWTAGTQVSEIDNNIYISDIAFHPDGQRFVAVGHNPSSQDRRTGINRSGIVRVYSVNAEGVVSDESANLEGHQDWVRGASFTGDGTLMATLDAAGTVLLWDTQGDANNWLTLSEVRLTQNEGELTLHYPFAPRFSLDGSTLIVPGQYGEIRFWSPSASPEIE